MRRHATSTGLIIGLLLICVMSAVIEDHTHPLLWLVGVLLLLLLVCGASALLNLAIFPPIFRLLARLTGKQRVTHPKTTDDHAA